MGGVEDMMCVVCVSVTELICQDRQVIWNIINISSLTHARLGHLNT